MKSTIYKFTFSILALVLVVSCEKFLEENNRSGLTAAELYGTESGIESLVNSCYTPTRFWYGKEGGIALTELGTDLIMGGAAVTDNGLDSYDAGKLMPTNSNSQAYWERFYGAVNTCNTALEWLPKAELKDNVRKVRTGEVRFLRAFYYWHIVETWGNVHLNLKAVSTPENTAYRSSIEAFYNEAIIPDLNAAIENLVGVTKNSDGRVTLAAAQALKARVLLTRASAEYIPSPNKQQDYLDAAALADSLIANTSFALNPSYANLFSIDNSNGNLNKEVIWYINYTQDLTLAVDVPSFAVTNSFRADGGNQAHLHYIMVYDESPGLTRTLAYGRPFNRYMPTLRFLQLFDETIDQRYYASFQTVWKANDAKKVTDAVEKFPRMKLNDTAIFALKSVATPAQKSAAKGKYTLMDADSVYDNGHDVVKDHRRYISLVKFIDPKRVSSNEIRGTRDAFVFRIAEMYLIAAEAHMQTNNPTKAVERLNTLRRTRAIAGKESQMEITAAELSLDFILDERGRELGGEQLRWFDLKRTGKLVEYVKKWNPMAKGSIKEHHMLRPIPQSQLDVITNKAEFGQNPGYN